MTTIDYNSIAARYDQHRPSGGDLCFDRLAAALAEAQPKHVLEFGAGTGNTTRFIGAVMPGLLVAVEPSEGMAAQARAKAVPGCWLRAHAPRFPFADGAFDAAYSSYVLQHIPDLDVLFQECARMLRPGGLMAHITVPPHYIETHPLNRYFPSFAAIDLKRFRPLDEVVQKIASAGFELVRWDVEHEPPKPLDHAYLARVEARFLSTFDLMPEDEYESGCARMRADIEQKGAGGAVVREAVLIQAVKGAWGR